MTEEQAVKVANAFIAGQIGPEPRIDGDRYAYSFLKAQMSIDGEWSVVYTIEFPDNPNRIWDGPVVVVVNPLTGEASFFE